MTSPKPVVAVDIDDVLSASAAGFVEYSNRRWGLEATVDLYNEEWAITWGVPLETAEIWAHEVHASGIFGKYKHLAGALPVLKRLSDKYNFVCVTSRRKILRPETNEWLRRHFPGIFEEVHYVGIWDSDEHAHQKIKQTKTELLKEINAHILVDDQLKHCLGAAKAGIKSLLFGDYPWNQAGRLPKNVVRVQDWHQVEKELLR